VNPHYLFVARRAGHRCEYCHAPEVAFNFPFEVEHISPSARGGASDPSNFALGCRACNLFKSDETSAPDPLTNELVRLFHPRKGVRIIIRLRYAAPPHPNLLPEGEGKSAKTKERRVHHASPFRWGGGENRCVSDHFSVLMKTSLAPALPVTCSATPFFRSCFDNASDAS
jgi:HNH endonuclease